MRARRIGSVLMATLTIAGGLAVSAGAAVKQRSFDSPEAAFGALVAALRTGDAKALAEILGPDGRPLLSSGDAVADRRERERFLQSYDEAHTLEAGGGKIVLVVGKDEFPFPIPLVPDGTTWRFDTRLGRDEILSRRIGRNELSTIEVCLAYADAQREYYMQDRIGAGLLQYARKFESLPGKRDGLYWPTKPDEPPSPLGSLVAEARAEGYRREQGKPIPYHGYFYRILTAQGPDAPGGAYDYVANGKMIGGFALVAFPAQWGASGVMTFMVNHDGVVYQKNLGPNSAQIARGMKAFNPDSGWERVVPSPPRT